MFYIRPSTFLRYALLGDAIASGATGLLSFAGAGLLSSLLGLPEPLLRYAGLVLLLASGWVAPTTLGSTFVLFQAFVVAVFAVAQAYGTSSGDSAGIAAA